MKYGDLITVLLAVVFFLSLGYTIGVNSGIWIIPVIFLILLVIFVYKIWIEK